MTRHRHDPSLSISHSRLLELVHYDPETGIFSPRQHRPGVRHKPALGNVDCTGYRRICIEYRRYLAQRLAWFYMTGAWPVNEIDHRDVNKDNNAWNNLREAGPSGNSANKAIFRNNTSGFKGVSLVKATGRWQASIRFAGKLIYLGSYGAPDEAHRAYVAAAERLQGEFARAA